MAPSSAAAPALAAPPRPNDRGRHRQRRRAPLQAAPDPAAVALPEPPSPPFHPTDDGWVATLPGRLGARATVAVSARGVRLGAVTVTFEEIAHVTVSLGRGDDQGVDVRYELETYAGRHVRLRTASLRQKAADQLYDVADHLWLVLRTAVAPRLRTPIVDAVAEGLTVALAGLLLTPDGLAAERRRALVVPWRHIGDPLVDRRTIVVPAGVKVFTTPLASRDSILLLDVLAEIRAQRLGSA
jgi:hypothetical protein